jgi:thiol peroxidase
MAHRLKALRWESRAVFVVDQNGIIQHVEYVPVGGQEPNYDATLAVLKELA